MSCCGSDSRAGSIDALVSVPHTGTGGVSASVRVMAERGKWTAQEFRQLVAGARTGDGEALGKLLASCQAYLSLLANRELGLDLRRKVGASDLVQKTFLDAQKDIESFEGNTPQEFFAWVERILVNNLADCARQYRSTDKRQLDREVSIDQDSLPMDLPGDDSTPSSKAMAREEHEKLQEAIDRLTEDYRTIIVLRNQERKPFEEIGRLMGRSTDAAKKLWGRAILQLEKEMNNI